MNIDAKLYRVFYEAIYSGHNIVNIDKAEKTFVYQDKQGNETEEDIRKNAIWILIHKRKEFASSNDFVITKISEITLVKPNSLKERFELLRLENIMPESLELEYNNKNNRARVMICNTPFSVTNFMKPENANKVINDYQEFCKKIINLPKAHLIKVENRLRKEVLEKMKELIVIKKNRGETVTFKFVKKLAHEINFKISHEEINDILKD